MYFPHFLVALKDFNRCLIRRGGAAPPPEPSLQLGEGREPLPESLTVFYKKYIIPSKGLYNPVRK